MLPPVKMQFPVKAWSAVRKMLALVKQWQTMSSLSYLSILSLLKTWFLVRKKLLFNECPVWKKTVLLKLCQHLIKPAPQQLPLIIHLQGSNTATIIKDFTSTSFSSFSTLFLIFHSTCVLNNATDATAANSTSYNSTTPSSTTTTTSTASSCSKAGSTACGWL
jgi:hypothetical protein